MQREAERRGQDITLTSGAIAGAMDSLISGDPDQHDRFVLDAVGAVAEETVILFAQFSMERILPGSAAIRTAPVIGPASEGVAGLRTLISSR